MATMNSEGNVLSPCILCDGANSVFEWKTGNTPFGSVQITQTRAAGTTRERRTNFQYVLFRCCGCGAGGLGIIANDGAQEAHPPQATSRLIKFYPETKQRLRIPNAVPDGIKAEFREAEDCMANNCFRAAAGMFRSTLDKTLRANGYNVDRANLYNQIEAANTDGVITTARRNRAHEDIRVMGNDVLHDEWHEISLQDVNQTHHYCQRILEDFYDDRPEVERLLVDVGRLEGEAPEPEPEEG